MMSPPAVVTERCRCGYARISDDKLGDAHGVAAQEVEIREFGDEQDQPVERMYVDNDVSAFSGAERPHYQDLLTDMRADKISMVTIWHANRLHRNVEEVIAFIKIARAHKVRLFSVMLGGEYNLNRASGREQLIADTLKAETESAHRGERIALARRAQAGSSNWGGGNRPYGWGVPFDPPRWRRVMVDKVTREYREVEILDMGQHNIEETTEIKRWAEDFLAGVGLRQIVADLRRRGVQTVSQKSGRSLRRMGRKLPPASWSTAAVRQVLTYPRTSGHAVYKGKIVKRNAWPAILPEETRLRIIEKMADPGRRTSPGNTPKWLGSVIYECGRCWDGTWMSVRGDARGNPMYKCREGSHCGVPARQLDEYIGDLIVAILSRPDAVTLIEVPDAGIDIDGLKAERSVQEDRKRTAARLFATGVIDGGQLSEITSIADAALADVQQQLAEAEKVDPLAGLVTAEHVAAVWQSLSLGRQREVLRVLMRVIVLPGAVRREGRRVVDIDPDRILIEPRRPWSAGLAQAHSDRYSGQARIEAVRR